MDSTPKQEVGIGGSRPSSAETQAADFTWEHGQEAMGFVAIGLCRFTEEEELEEASLVLEACLTPLCSVLVSAVLSLHP